MKTHTLAHLSPRANKLCPGVACQHVYDDDLTPLLHIHQHVTQLPIVLMDQVDPIWTHLLKRHHHAAGNQLQKPNDKQQGLKLNLSEAFHTVVLSLYGTVVNVSLEFLILIGCYTFQGCESNNSIPLMLAVSKQDN